MTNPNRRIYETPNPYSIVLQRETGEYNRHYEWADTMALRMNALEKGWPGFVDKGGITHERALEYAAAMQVLPQEGAKSVADLRSTRVYKEVSPQKMCLVALAVYGKSLTRYGTGFDRDTEASHILTIAEDYTHLRDPKQRREVGAVLMHGVAADAAANGFGELSYNVEEMNRKAIEDALTEYDVPFTRADRSLWSDALSPAAMLDTELVVPVNGLVQALEGRHPYLA